MSDFKSIEDELNKAQQKLTATRKEWKLRRARLLPVLDAMQRLEPSRVEFSDYFWLTIGIAGDKHKLAAAVRILRTRGFSTHEEGPKKGASSWCPLFSNDSGDTVYLNFSSTVCRRVQTGTKMVETPVFETVCDELILDVPATAPPTPEVEIPF